MDVNRSHAIRHIGGGAASERGIPIAQPRWTQWPDRNGIPLIHLDRKSRRESGNALQLPSLRKPWQAVKNPMERHLPDIADHKVLVHVRRRQATAEFGIGAVDQFAASRGIGVSFGERIPSQKAYISTSTLSRNSS